MNLHPANSSKSYRVRTFQRAQRGVGLIEVLIAVLVLSIGILGLAALQTRALSDNGSSMSRSAATAATYSIIEALRLDRTVALAGTYNGTVTTNACPATGPTLKEFQLNNWCSKQLGNFLGKISTTKGIVDCNPAGLCTVTIQFDDSKATGATINDTQFQLVTQASI
ncbi:type IV pilus modification protein PilV [Stenotrophobium rhamnosiphilum]|uniref:Type IV pilus modification protein PilV n=1 Tax=Stenotrophobium rhamnosiphilum TaxID=2029166 RepID=A0A2T5ML07_9GAMM|nr:type IV pilus modification protein PilV [Stenotrophobium rhamnosiphilum]PTU33255.1 type IV pilus modification protein PilV [Stenotrophobium rhamnosiphilum]